MIPISLSLEGLYSYQERQCISFDTLIDAGLFGVFGKVGSGKSSLLEAISFALYGETERLNAKDNRAYNMMNLKSNRSLIDFEFYNFQEKKYRIVREFKRNSKRFEDVKRTDAVLYEWKQEQWVPLDHVNVEGIIGLTYENFKRTIIIPQGKFKEFIELGGAPRTKMMQELFGLDRFDLSDKVRRLYLTNKEQLDRLEGALLTHEELSETQWDENQKAYEVATQDLKVLTVQLQEARLLLERLKEVKQAFDELQHLEEQEKIFAQKQKEVAEEAERLQQFEQVYQVFHQRLELLQGLAARLTNSQKELKTATQDFADCHTQYDQAVLDLQVHEKEHQEVEVLKSEVQDLELLVQMQEANTKLVAFKQRIQKGGQWVQHYKEQVAEKEVQILKIQEDYKTLRSQRVETALWLAVGQWFLERKRLRSQNEQEQERWKATKQQIKKIEAERRTILPSEGDWKTILETKRVQLEAVQQTLLKQQQQLEVSQQLSHYASDLREGEACPLCGALEHPEITMGEEVQTALNALYVKQDEVAEALKKQTEEERVLEALAERIRLYEFQALDIQKEIEKGAQALLVHETQFVWSDFNPNDEEGFWAKSDEAKRLDEEVERKEKELEEALVKKDTLTKDLQKFEAELDRIRNDEVAWHSQFQTLEKQLKQLTWVQVQDKDVPTIEKHKEEKQNLITEIVSQYQRSVQRVAELQPILATKSTLKERLEAEVLSWRLEHQKLEEEFARLVQANGFEDKQAVVSILSQNLEVAEMKARIEAFKIENAILQNRVQVLRVQLAAVPFDAAHYQTQEQHLSAVEIRVQETTEQQIQLKATGDRLKIALAQKKALLLEQERLEKRAQNIQVLSNMFKANGFVNYVSAIYLKNLCARANSRFHRLTKNQLSLELSDSNEFEIRDYLNDGKMRSVKTLSGGQSFQVSLSLALALAESVQSLSKSERNFFFIDEGFGTQDAESVDIVFETLQNLHKENRIVGIISHVEELQERIPVSLTVVKDPEKGSLIQKSYEV